MDGNAVFPLGPRHLLTAGADALVESNTDEDAALLLALQTRQQLVTTMLSLTAQDTKESLRLFGLG